MTQEEKQFLLILLKDLCARLPYEVYGEYSWKCGKSYKRELTGNLMGELILSFNSSGDSEFKPYLRPMSSMTKEEDKEWQSYKCSIAESCDRRLEEKIIVLHDWFNSRHLDWRGLIPKGLALEAPEGMYKTE